MSEKQEWVLTFTRPGQAGRVIGRYGSRDESMLAAQEHFDRETGLKNSDEQVELGWQMSFAAATALAPNGAYRVRRSDVRGR